MLLTNNKTCGLIVEDTCPNCGCPFNEWLQIGTLIYCPYCFTSTIRRGEDLDEEVDEEEE